jgi:hypothetical protein
LTLNTTWSRGQNSNQPIKPHHLLWTLRFLKHNPPDLVNLFEVSTKTGKKHVDNTAKTLFVYLPEVLYVHMIQSMSNIHDV